MGERHLRRVDAELAAVADRAPDRGVGQERVVVAEPADDLVEREDARDPGRQRDARPRVEHLGARLGAHAAHVGDEVLGAEVARGHRRAEELAHRVDAARGLHAGDDVQVLEPGVAQRRARPGRPAPTSRSSGRRCRRAPACSLRRCRSRTTRSGSRSRARRPRVTDSRPRARRPCGWRAVAPRPWRRRGPRPRGRRPRRRDCCAGSLARTSGRLAGAKRRLRSRAISAIVRRPAVATSTRCGAPGTRARRAG